RALLTTGLKTLAPLLPGLRLVGCTLLPRAGPPPCGGLGHPWSRATAHQGRGGPWPPWGPPCVRTLLSPALFKSILGPRSLRDALAVAQTRPIPAADLEHRGDRRRARARAGSGAAHGPPAPAAAPPRRGCA